MLTIIIKREEVMCGTREDKAKDCEFERFNLVVSSINSKKRISREEVKRVCKRCGKIEGSTHDWRNHLSSLEAMGLEPAFSRI